MEQEARTELAGTERGAIIEFAEKYAPYLEDMRKRLLLSALIFVVFTIAGFFLSKYILWAIIDLFKIEHVTITSTSPFQSINLAINFGLSCGFVSLIVSILIQAYFFLRQALTLQERRFTIFIVFTSILLFIAGFTVGFMTMYYAIETLANFNQDLSIPNLWDINTFLSEILLTSSLLGLLFQFPIVITVLVKIGAVEPETLKKSRRIIVLITFGLVSLLPPTDGLSLVLMTLPIIVLFEVTLLATSIVRRKALLN